MSEKPSYEGKRREDATEEELEQYSNDRIIRHAATYDAIPLRFDGEQWVQIGEVMPKTSDCSKC